jgi:hypothetical protein
MELPTDPMLELELLGLLPLLGLCVVVDDPLASLTDETRPPAVTPSLSAT